MGNKYQENNPFPRGSEWRKWDLHVHAPGGKMNDHYGDSDEAWRKFCQTLADSEVEAFGITDYFSLENFFRCKQKFEDLHAGSKKVLFPNLELRLSDSVNKDGERVELHILLRPNLEPSRAKTLVSHLLTETNEDGSKRKLPCSELSTKEQFESATVTKETVMDALEKTFGPEQMEDPRDYLVVVPANHGGLRCDLGEKRKVELAARIDEMTHAVFGNQGNVRHFLDPTRTKGHNRLPPKPVLGGSDAHGQKDLEAWLGRDVDDGNTQKTVTWIKADINFDGLLQIKAEPRSRVRLGAAEPDQKDPYRVIESVSFGETADFPRDVVLNPNLVAVIGPRSSGKSSLLAHIAYAVDPEYTIARQEEVEPRPKAPGPAPGKTWAEVEDLEVEVRWREPSTDAGKLIYVPQNALHSISQKVDEIAARIGPALREADPSFDTALREMQSAVDSANEEIRLGVADWFETQHTMDGIEGELRDRGDKEAIARTRDELSQKISAKREEAKLSKAEAELYEAVMQEIGKIEGRLTVIREEEHQLSAHVKREGDALSAQPSPRAEVRITPSPSDLPDTLRRRVQEIATKKEDETIKMVAEALVSYQAELEDELGNLTTRHARLQSENKELIERNEANSEIEALAKAKRRQDELLELIKAEQERLSGLSEEAQGVVDRVAVLVGEREVAVKRLIEAFESEERGRASMRFGIESKFDPAEVEILEGRFNRNRNGPFMGVTEPLDISRCFTEAGTFMAAVRAGDQRLRSGQDAQAVVESVLATTPKTLFWAEIDGDRIGGFETSSMSPGKQALFALELILDDTDEPWPLLIDQPEDDLDSRSIATQLVNYLVDRKVERQIIMVSHDANLVIGADAEQVLVANRHGAKTENAGSQTFDYFSGSLEHSRPRRERKVALECGGIREHACDILDGGEEAFTKRRRKYKIS